MTERSADQAQDTGTSIFASRMQAWENDDLMFTAAQRRLIDTEFPGAVAVFDFPELRARLESLDQTAMRNRQRRHSSGIAAVLFAGLGALLSAILPLIELLGGDFPRWVFAASAAISLVGLVWVLWLAVGDRGKQAWLENRMRAERLRQFQFQFMLHEAELGARALSGGGALETWNKARAAASAFIEAWLDKPARAELTAIIDDVNNRKSWLIESWKGAAQLSGRTDLDDYLSLLRRLRIDVQLSYIREKLAPGIGSPETLAAIASTLSWVFTAITVLLTSVSAVALFRGMSMHGQTFPLLVTLVAVCGVLSGLVRVAGEGLQLRSDRDRYHWYRAALEDIDARFHDRDPARRLATLRELEELSYREMREFLKTHAEARFSVG